MWHGYFGCIGVSIKGVQLESRASPSALRMAVIGRQKLKVYLASKPAINASSMAIAAMASIQQSVRSTRLPNSAIGPAVLQLSRLAKRPGTRAAEPFEMELTGLLRYPKRRIASSTIGLREMMTRQSSSSLPAQICLAAAFIALLSVFSGAAQAERRAAIVVGNGEYQFAPLTNPKNDAKLIAATLTELDFDVLLFYDVKKSAAKDLEDAIRAHLIGADMAVLYYAGHAVQYEGQNLLLPVDMRTGSAKEVVDDAIALNDADRHRQGRSGRHQADHPRCVPEQPGRRGKGAAAGPCQHRVRHRPGADRLRHQRRRGGL